MRETRFEFGISRVTPEGVEVYARRGDGKSFFKTYPNQAGDVLEQAQADFAHTKDDWRKVDAPVRTDLSLVLDAPGRRLFVGGEAAVDGDALWDARPGLIVSLNTIKTRTQATIDSYRQDHPTARHLHLPFRDTLPQYQTKEGTLHAAQALAVVQAALRQDGVTLVHCLMGVHRSVSLCAVALSRNGIFGTAREAFLHIHARRHVATWVPETVAWLRGLSERPPGADA